MSSLRRLLRELIAEFDQVENEDVLTHSMVAFTRRNRWWSNARGRKECAQNFGPGQLRSELGDYPVPLYDPDVESQTLSVGNEDLFLALLPDSPKAQQIHQERERNRPTLDENFQTVSDGRHGPARRLFNITGMAYDDRTTYYVFPDGSRRAPQCGHQINDFTRIPSGTQVRLLADEEVERFCVEDGEEPAAPEPADPVVVAALALEPAPDPMIVLTREEEPADPPQPTELDSAADAPGVGEVMIEVDNATVDDVLVDLVIPVPNGRPVTLYSLLGPDAISDRTIYFFRAARSGIWSDRFRILTGEQVYLGQGGFANSLRPGDIVKYASGFVYGGRIKDRTLYAMTQYWNERSTIYYNSQTGRILFGTEFLEDAGITNFNPHVVNPSLEKYIVIHRPWSSMR